MTFPVRLGAGVGAQDLLFSFSIGCEMFAVVLVKFGKRGGAIGEMLLGDVGVDLLLLGGDGIGLLLLGTGGVGLLL